MSFSLDLLPHAGGHLPELAKSMLNRKRRYIIVKRKLLDSRQPRQDVFTILFTKFMWVQDLDGGEFCKQL